jgi:hypothetical protein
MFPTGWPGFALVLLRASVVLALLIHTFGHRPEPSSWIQGAAILLSAALAVGFLTPIAAVIVLVIHGLIWSGASTVGPAVAIIVSLDAIALALLGPGAYSLDSNRFGRREVVLPPS